MSNNIHLHIKLYLKNSNTIFSEMHWAKPNNNHLLIFYNDNQKFTGKITNGHFTFFKNRAICKILSSSFRDIGYLIDAPRFGNNLKNQITSFHGVDYDTN